MAAGVGGQSGGIGDHEGGARTVSVDFGALRHLTKVDLNYFDEDWARNCFHGASIGLRRAETSFGYWPTRPSIRSRRRSACPQ